MLSGMPRKRKKECKILGWPTKVFFFRSTKSAQKSWWVIKSKMKELKTKLEFFLKRVKFHEEKEFKNISK
jgi:hypothetical protein